MLFLDEGGIMFLLPHSPNNNPAKHVITWLVTYIGIVAAEMPWRKDDNTRGIIINCQFFHIPHVKEMKEEGEGKKGG